MTIQPPGSMAGVVTCRGIQPARWVEGAVCHYRDHWWQRQRLRQQRADLKRSMDTHGIDDPGTILVDVEPRFAWMEHG